MNAGATAADIVGRRNELELEIARLVAEVPATGWTSLKFGMKCVGNVQGGLIFVDRNGVEEREFPPRPSYRRVRELRDIMYREGHGTWFAMAVEVENDGHLHASYNYDYEPEWEVPIGDDEYVTDLERYPRTADHTPQWLRDKLATSGQSA